MWTRYLVWHQNQRAITSESRDILRGKFHQRPNLPPNAAGPPPAHRACAAPTESHARIVVVHPIECDHIYVNRVISHEVMVSECITLQTLQRRFRPGTPCVGLILKTYSRQKTAINSDIRHCYIKRNELTEKVVFLYKRNPLL